MKLRGIEDEDERVCGVFAPIWRSAFLGGFGVGADGVREADLMDFLGVIEK